MFDFLIGLITDYIDWQRDAADVLAGWMMQSIDKVAKSPTPIYLPKSPMTAEEIERVRWRTDHPSRAIHTHDYEEQEFRYRADRSRS